MKVILETRVNHLYIYYKLTEFLFFMTFIPMHAQQLVIIQWMDSCIPKEEEESPRQTQVIEGKPKHDGGKDRQTGVKYNAKLVI